MKTMVGRIVLTGTLTLTSLSAIPSLSGYDFDACVTESDCRLLSAGELDGLRGGFSFMSGTAELEVRIGISRAVFINDELVAVSQQLVLPTLAQLRDGGFAANGAALGTLSAISAPAPARVTPAPGGDASAASPGATTPTQSPAVQPASAAPVATASQAPVAVAAADAVAGVRINGVPVSSGTPVIVSADELRSLVVQNGPGNVVVPSAGDIRASTLATVLQNSLDNQSIRTLTTLSASSNALSAYRDAIFRDAVSRATTDLLR